MTLAQLERRVAKLEKEVDALKPPAQTGRWWIEQSGQFANDPVYEEIVRAGRKYRESLRPKAKKRRR